MPPRRLIRPFLLVGLLGASCEPTAPPPPAAPPPPEQPPVSYADEIRPLLATKCFPCHGQLDLANESGVRLDSREHATRRREESGAQPVFPGDPSRSALLQKLFVAATGDEDVDEAHTVSRDEHDLLSRWIEQGAFYEPHWAFQPLPDDVPLPASRGSLWPLTPFDQFTLASLGEDQPRPPLPPLRWLHRAALDLTGLPPGPEVRNEFRRNLESGKERTARQIAVDQLLASPAFGEHLGGRWLQEARYADFLAPGHPASRQVYRDWVVQAFNGNLPYDQFLTAQVAGDLVQPPAGDQLVATAFLRLHPLPSSSDNPVGDSAALRTEAFSRTVLGLELRCARCHDHPLDPLTPADHRDLQAFFGGTGESAVLPAPGVTPTPSHLVLTSEAGKTLHARTLSEANALEAVENAIAGGEERFTTWLATPDKLPLISDLVGAFPLDHDGNRSPNVTLDGTGAAVTGTLASVDGFRGQAVQLDGAQAVQFPGMFPFTRSDRFTFIFWLRLPNLPAAPTPLLARTGSLPRGLELGLDRGHLTARIFREWPGNALGIRTTAPVLGPERWHQVAWSYDGSSTAEGLRLYVDGQPAEVTVSAGHLWKSAAPADAHFVLGADPGLAGTSVDDIQVFSRALTAPEVAHLHDSRSLTDALAAGDPETLRDYYFHSIDPEVRALARELPAKRAALVDAENQLREVSVMRRVQDPVDPPAIPAFLQQPESASTRLDLARWLSDPAHPLTARIFVNRLWETFFGRPLIDGNGGLGLGSPAPANQALLDWLARDFVNHGWDVKDLCRRIVLSATYNQALDIPLDPVRFRDRALAASGLLASPGQPGPFPRSLYLAWPLPGSSSPHPCPASEAPPRPGSAGTGSLSLAEADAVLSRLRASLETQAPGHDAGRLAFLFRSLTGREPTVDELARLGAVAREHKSATPPGESPWLEITAELLGDTVHEVLRQK